jgi:hypothetical protein
MEFARRCSYNGSTLYALDNCRFLTSGFNGANLPFTNSWKYSGVYVFVTQSADDEAFVKNLLNYKYRAGEGLTFLWLNDNSFNEVHAIFTNPGTRKITFTWGLGFSAYGVVLSQGASVGISENGFTVNGSVDFVGAKARLQGQTAKIDCNGSIEFQVRHNGGFDLAEALDSGLKTVFDHEFETKKTACANGFALTASQHILRAADAMDLQIHINPVHKQLNVFLPANRLFESSFMGVSGKTVSIKALLGACWTLAETVTHRYKTDFFSTRYYLTLAGPFELKLNGDKTILPGLSGTEYFEFDDNVVIEFVPGNAAYFGEANKKNRLPTMSWLKYPQGTRYFSQPSEAPLFEPDGSGGLIFNSVPLLALEINVSVPQLFYRELPDIPAEACEALIYTQRFNLLCEGIKPLTVKNAPETRAVSPQGLMVGVSDGAWAWVSLANTNSIESETLLKLNNVDLPLRKAFADIDMNLVFDKPSSLAAYITTDDLFAFCLDDMWTLNMNPSVWNDSSMLIIKYGVNSTIREMAAGKPAFENALRQTQVLDGKFATEFETFLQLVDDPDFTGVLALGLKLFVNESIMNQSLKTVWHGIPETERNGIRAHHLIIRHAKAVLVDKSVSQKAAFVDALVFYRADRGISYSNEYNAKDYDFRTTALTLHIKTVGLKALLRNRNCLLTN